MALTKYLAVAVLSIAFLGLASHALAAEPLTSNVQMEFNASDANGTTNTTMAFTGHGQTGWQRAFHKGELVIDHGIMRLRILPRQKLVYANIWYGYSNSPTWRFLSWRADKHGMPMGKMFQDKYYRMYPIQITRVLVGVYDPLQQTATCTPNKGPCQSLTK